MSSVGPPTPAVTKGALPATYRFGTPWTRRVRSTTLVLGSSPIRHVPMWWWHQAPSRSGVAAPAVPSLARSALATSLKRSRVRRSAAEIARETAACGRP